MTPEARVAAAIEILDTIGGGEPAEKVLTTWARRNRFAGSGDRAAIRDLVFDAVRRRRSLGWLGGGEDGRALMIGRLRDAGADPAGVFTGAGFAPGVLSPEEAAVPAPLTGAPEAVRLDAPDWAMDELRASLGETLEPVLALLRERAPVFLRVNAGRGTREAAVAALAREGIAAAPHGLSPTALEVTGNARRVQGSEAYRTGLVEIQDAASQAVVDLLLPHVRGRRVLDYCAGGGGKALALAAGGAGEVTAHDADPGRMADLPARAARAGARIAVETRPSGPFDAVLCDAPCSGSGAWRRQPEAKWRLTPEGLERLCAVQDGILDRAAGLVGAGGVLAYATCSLFRAENEARRDAFLARHPGWRLAGERRLSPLEGGDGFYVALFARV